MINKKGDYKELLIELIVIIGVIAIIFFVIMRFSQNADESTQEILCRGSVILRGKATIALVDNLVEFEKITPLACNTKDLGKLKGSREDVKKEIADYSAKCWWQFAEGSVADLFKVDRKEKACFVCYTFTIKEKLDEGMPSKVQMFEEPTLEERKTENKISSYELTNFLVSKNYNPGIIYGGGTKNYFGINYVYELNSGVNKDNARIIKPSKINTLLVNGYVQDYSYKLTQDTKDKINEIGVNLQKADVGNLFVIAADGFSSSEDSSIENSDARTIIENTRLNTNDTNYDAILVMLDLKGKTMRIHLGSDHSVFIKDYELNDIMEDNFKSAINDLCAGKSSDVDCNLKAINKALLDSVSEVSDKLIGQSATLSGISPKSYYYYITNGGYTWMMTTDIIPEQRYAIAYVGTSDETAWWSTKAATMVGAAAGIVGGVALSLTGFGASVGLPVIATSVATISGAGAIGGLAGYGAGQAVPQENIRPNNILIIPINDLGDQCTTVK